MINRKLLFSFLALGVFILLLGGCSRAKPAVVEIGLAPVIGANNKPQGTIENIPALLPQVFLVGKVVNAAGGTVVTVRWYRGGEVLSTEVFTGQRDESHPYDFSASPLLKEENFFASILQRPNEIWPVGDYRAEVYLGGSLVKTLNFKILPESAAEIEARRSSLLRLFFGDSLEGGEIVQSRTAFSQLADEIYIGVEVAEKPAGERLKLTVEYLPQAKSLVSFAQDLHPGLSLFILKRQQLAPVLGINYWKTGAYVTSLYIDDILVQKATFQIK